MDRQRHYIDIPKNSFETVYIAGKVTGRDYAEARAQFDAAADTLGAMGYGVVNPMDIVAPGTGWREAMRICLHVLPMTDYICLLPGWEASPGACMEKEIADKVGIKVIQLTDV